MLENALIQICKERASFSNGIDKEKTASEEGLRDSPTCSDPDQSDQQFGATFVNDLGKVRQHNFRELMFATNMFGPKHGRFAPVALRY